MNGQSAAGKAVEDLLQTRGKDTCGCVRNAKEKNANEERCRSKIGHEKQPGKMQHQNMTNELNPSLVKQREGIGMLYHGFLQSAVEKGEGWNIKASGYSNERVLLNSIKLASQKKKFSWTWGTKLTIQVYLKQIQTKFTLNTYLQVGYYFHKKKNNHNYFNVRTVSDASKSTGLRELFFNIFFFFTDKEDVSIQHLHRVIWGIQLVYNILFRLAIKISVATAKHRDTVVVSELYEQLAIKHKIIWWW